MGSFAYSQEAKIDTIIYKKKDTTSLNMLVIYPDSSDDTKKFPAMVFFRGGGWEYGSLPQSLEHHQATYFAKRGVVCFIAEYGVKGRQESSLNFWECIAEAKSAVRYIRENSTQFNVDEEKIVAVGGSSGGHLAATTGIINGLDDPNDNLFFNSKPNALVLFNPVIDFGPADSILFKMVGEKYLEISPLQNIRRGVPPTIILQGTEDQWTPVSMIKYYKHVMESVGSRCDLFLYEGQKHGFFNYRRSKKYFKETVLEVDKFLISLGYINGEPTIMNED